MDKESEQGERTPRGRTHKEASKSWNNDGETVPSAMLGTCLSDSTPGLAHVIVMEEVRHRLRSCK
jgi:hypothetical protein